MLSQLELLKVALKSEHKTEGFAAQIEHECLVGSAINPCLYSAAIEIIYDTGFFEPNYILVDSQSQIEG
jgi:hypothetical protein